MDTKSDTPRTDAYCNDIQRNGWLQRKGSWPDFARTLERELTAALADAKALADAARLVIDAHFRGDLDNAEREEELRQSENIAFENLQVALAQNANALTAHREAMKEKQL